MVARVGVAGGDARVVERRAQEHLLDGAALGVVVGGPRPRHLERHAGQRAPAPALVLGDQDPAVAGERALRVALLHEQPEPVAGQRLRREVEVRLEDADEEGGQERGLAEPVHRGKEGALHGAPDGDDARLDRRQNLLGPPARVARPDLVALEQRPAVGQAEDAAVLGAPDEELLGGTKPPEVDQAAEAQPHQGRRLPGKTQPSEGALERVAAPDRRLGYADGRHGDEVAERRGRRHDRGNPEGEGERAARGGHDDPTAYQDSRRAPRGERFSGRRSRTPAGRRESRRAGSGRPARAPS